MVNLSCSSDGNPMVYPLCPNCALDPLGYHSVTCKSGGDVTTRHITLCKAVHSTFQRAGLSAHLEVGCGWGKGNARTRPADILVTNWDYGTSAAFDITVTSPLNSPNMLEAGMYQGVQLSQQNTESTQKMILSVLSWAGDAYHWQLRWSLGSRGVEGLLTGGYSFSHLW